MKNEKQTPNPSVYLLFLYVSLFSFQNSNLRQLQKCKFISKTFA